LRACLRRQQLRAVAARRTARDPRQPLLDEQRVDQRPVLEQHERARSRAARRKLETDEAMADDAVEALARLPAERFPVVGAAAAARRADAGQAHAPVGSDVDRVAVDDTTDGNDLRCGRLRRGSGGSGRENDSTQNLHGPTLLQRVTRNADPPLQTKVRERRIDAIALLEKHASHLGRAGFDVSRGARCDRREAIALDARSRRMNADLATPAGSPDPRG